MDLFSLCYSDDNKKNTFNNSENNGHGLKNVTCKQTFMVSLYWRKTGDCDSVSHELEPTCAERFRGDNICESRLLTTNALNPSVWNKCVDPICL